MRLMQRPLRARSRPLACLLLAALAAASALAGDLRIRFVDVGQGDAVLIKTPSGKAWLVDGGPKRSAVTTRLEEAMAAEGLTRLDGMLVSHPHLDHFGGMIRLIRKVEVGRFVRNIDIEAVTYSRFVEDLESRGIAHEEVALGEQGWCPALQVDVLAARGQQHFDAALAEAMRFSALSKQALGEILIRGHHGHEGDRGLGITGLDLNDYSIVVRIRYGAFSILLTGDATEHVEHELVASGKKLSADVLKVAHHGSRYSNTLEWLQAVGPADAVIQCGAGNSYGHPHREAVRRLLGQRVRIHRNDTDGELVLEASSDGTYRIEGHQVTAEAMPEPPARAPAHR